MTESFVQWNICDEMTGQVRCHTNPDVFQYTNCSETIEPERVTCLNQYCSDKVKTFDAKMEIDDEDVPVFRNNVKNEKLERQPNVNLTSTLRQPNVMMRQSKN